MKVHYPKLYNMTHLSLNVFTASKGFNYYILSVCENITSVQPKIRKQSGKVIIISGEGFITTSYHRVVC